MDKLKICNIELYIDELHNYIINNNLSCNYDDSVIKLASTVPFGLEYIEPIEWLEHIFIPNMKKMIIDKKINIDKLCITPYFEESLKDNIHKSYIINILRKLENAF